ncbi:hypothetical protein H9L21_13865 [Aeromicrobium senzhongii]|uniref:Uncharacterized protein n=1 Tax=Aeromicrobium senzhongii TaxID=2663859 RepID=A0ABX6SSP2_9ACTN|nr:hypothetical protein [Aeromicrobium senzhongii]MTB88532.1 hypothetical protein [Aeromicrobium senzhongii]QNL94153.1 hypothetical protein H9L21_13865 [Aeromicrobium senzhongii]
MGDPVEQVPVGQVAQLTAEGLGLEGVKRVIALENQVAALQAKVAELQAELAESRISSQNLPALYGERQVTVWQSRR